jgi:hypothetical protein
MNVQEAEKKIKEKLLQVRGHLQNVEVADFEANPVARFRAQHAALKCFDEIQNTAFRAVSDLRATMLEE